MLHLVTETQMASLEKKKKSRDMRFNREKCGQSRSFIMSCSLMDRQIDTIGTTDTSDRTNL